MLAIEKMFNTPEVNYAYINKIDRLPEDAIIGITYIHIAIIITVVIILLNLIPFNFKISF